MPGDEVENTIAGRVDLATNQDTKTYGDQLAQLGGKGEFRRGGAPKDPEYPSHPPPDYRCAPLPEGARVDTILPEQEALLNEYARVWTAIGLSTEPADHKAAEAATVEAYAAANLPPPKEILWVGSPRALCRGEGHPLGKQEPSQCIFGQHDAYWLGYYECWRNVFGLYSQTEPLLGLQKLARSAGWGLVFDELAVLSERPKEIHLDAQGNLHHLEGDAIQYPDGWGFCAVHGLIVPSEWVHERANVDPKKVLAEPNADLRAAWCEIVGWERIIELLNPKVIDTHPTHGLALADIPVKYDFGQLLEADIGEGPMRFLKAKCGTGRIIVLPVDDHLQTALEANAWTYGFEGKEEIEKFQRIQGRT